MSNNSFTFLVCSERSGSNLITSMMNGHPLISAPPPSHLFRLFTSNEDNYGNLGKTENQQILLQDVADAFAAQLGEWSISTEEIAQADIEQECSVLAPVIALYKAEARMKSARNIFVKENHVARFSGRLQAELPDAKFVFMVRDPRDVAASYLQTDGIPGGVERAMSVWVQDQTDNLALFEQLQKRGMVHFIRYEDLISDGPKQLSSICKFLGLRFDAEMLNFHTSASTKRNAQRIKAWANLSEPLQSKNAGKYRKALNDAELEYIECMSSELMSAFSYQLDVVTTPLKPNARAARLDQLRPLLRNANYQLDNVQESETRQMRLQIIERVKSRRLS